MQPTDRPNTNTDQPRPPQKAEGTEPGIGQAQSATTASSSSGGATGGKHGVGVSVGQKIRDAVHVVHGASENLRGSILGAFDTMRGRDTSQTEAGAITGKGKEEMNRGMEGIKPGYKARREAAKTGGADKEESRKSYESYESATASAEREAGKKAGTGTGADEGETRAPRPPTPPPKRAEQTQPEAAASEPTGTGAAPGIPARQEGEPQSVEKRADTGIAQGEKQVPPPPPALPPRREAQQPQPQEGAAAPTSSSAPSGARQEGEAAPTDVTEQQESQPELHREQRQESEGKAPSPVPPFAADPGTAQGETAPPPPPSSSGREAQEPQPQGAAPPPSSSGREAQEPQPQGAAAPPFSSGREAQEPQPQGAAAPLTRTDDPSSAHPPQETPPAAGAEKQTELLPEQKQESEGGAPAAGVRDNLSAPGNVAASQAEGVQRPPEGGMGDQGGEQEARPPDYPKHHRDDAIDKTHDPTQDPEHTTL